ncbi:hypothetical protein BJ742DRAFT_704778 [Cladochytrium replicatum]|nr:hypothetical protein BJ742DRAFT_704778 [Cladochytrium replicatum]
MMKRVEQAKPVAPTAAIACPHGSVPAKKQRQRMKRAPYLDVAKVLNAPFGPPSGNEHAGAKGSHAMRPRGPPRIFGLKEAPTFHPTPEEFASPLRYIESIRRIGEKAGLCKIVPPKGWKPDCALDTETFWFRTRIQKLNSMEGASRATLNCLDQLHKYHSQNSIVFNRVPTIDKKPVDLAKLRKEVSSRGGFQAVSDGKKWPEVARAIGVSGKNFSNVAYTVKGLYAKWILPFEEFIENNSYGTTGGKLVCFLITRPAHPMLENLMTNSPARPGKTSIERSEPAVVPGQELCEFCKRGDKEDQMLLCDDCGRGFHMFCLTPPMQTLPESDWFCAKCLREVGNDYGFEDGEDRSLYHFQKIADTFKETYFAQRKGLSMQNDTATHSNGGTASRSPGSIVITEDEVEREFWRLIESPYDDVQVEYGADLHTSQHGSGFPVLEKQPTDPYSTCAWNLNNIPLLSESLFSNIRNDISGMMIPWIYIGMVFSTFCWHTEDHYTYSVNYHHFGETKTWYGIPSSDADAFEKCMQKTVPELFEGNPDLLFHLTTMLSPSVLTEHGVEVVVLDQRPGDFVITFPRSYHAGFNHGFNCAEAVNFALPDWLPYGLSCVERYHMYRRMPVFSHDELIVTTWKKDKSVKSAIWLEGQLQYVVKRQTALRTEVRKAFPHLTEIEEEFDMPLEDEGQCIVCHQYCYLSRITCANCSPSSTVCLSHAEEICSCEDSKIVMTVRFSDQKLLDILSDISEIAQQPSRWKQMYLEAISRHRRPPLQQLIELHSAGAQFAGVDESHTAELRHLRRFIDRAHKWIERAGKIMQPPKTNARSTRRASRRRSNLDNNRANGGIPKSASPLPDLTLPSKERSWEKLEDHIRQLEKLQFGAPDVGEFRNFVDEARNLRDRLRAVLVKGSLLVGGDRQGPKANENWDAFDRAALDAAGSEISAEIAQLWSDVQQQDVYFDELPQVLELMTTIDWRLDIETKLNSKSDITYEEILELMDEAKERGARADHPVVIRLRRLKQMGDTWRLAATTLTKARSISIEELEDILGRADGIPAHQDVLQELQECYARAKRWVEKAKSELGNAGLLDIASSTGLLVEHAPSGEHMEIQNFNDSILSPGSAEIRTQSNTKSRRSIAVRSIAVLNELMTAYSDISGKLPPIRLDSELVHMVREEVRRAEEWSAGWRKRMFPKNPTGSFASMLAETCAVVAASFAPQPESVKDLCLCRGGQSSFMIECQSCLEVFHGACVRVSKKGSKSLFFICPLCDVGSPSNNVAPNPNKSLTFPLIELALREAGSLEADKLRRAHSFSTWLQTPESSLTFAPIELPHLEELSVHLRKWYPQVQKAMAIAGAVMSGTPVMAKETLLSNFELASRLRSSLRGIENCPVPLDRERVIVRNALAKISPLHPRILEAKRVAEERKNIEMEIEFIEEDPSQTFCICNQPAEEGRPMIMCDYCNDWFHFSCVLLTKEQVESIDKYCCPRCDSRTWNQTYNHEKKRKRADNAELVERPFKMERAEKASQFNRAQSKPVSGPTYQQMRQYTALPTSTRSTVSFVGVPPDSQHSLQSSSFAPPTIAGEKRKRTDEPDASRRIRMHPHTLPGPSFMKNLTQPSLYSLNYASAPGTSGWSSKGHFTLPPLPPPPPLLAQPPPMIRSGSLDQRAPRIPLPKPYDSSDGSNAQETQRHSISSSFGYPQHGSSSAGSASSFNHSYYRNSPSTNHSPSLQTSMYQPQAGSLPRFEPLLPALPPLNSTSHRGQQSPYGENLPEYH